MYIEHAASLQMSNAAMILIILINHNLYSRNDAITVNKFSLKNDFLILSLLIILIAHQNSALIIKQEINKIKIVNFSRFT